MLVFIIKAGFDAYQMKNVSLVAKNNQNPATPAEIEIDYAISIAGEYNMEIVG